MSNRIARKVKIFVVENLIMSCIDPKPGKTMDYE